MKLSLYTNADLIKEIDNLSGELKQISLIKDYLKETKFPKWRKRYIYLLHIQLANIMKLHYLFKIKSKRVDI